MTPETRTLIDAVLSDTQTTHGASRWGEYARCQRAHHLRYVEDWHPRGVALHFGVGRLVHSCLQYLQEGVIAAIAGTEPPLARDWRDVLEVASLDPTVTAEAAEEAWRLVHAYETHWGRENAGWPAEAEIVACELPLEGAIGGIPYTARADTILRIGGQIVIADTKTRSQRLPEDPHDRAHKADGWRTKVQFLGLSWLVRNYYELDYTPSVWVNAIVKTKLVQFDRLLVPITDGDIEKWYLAQSEVAQQGLVGRLQNYNECAPDFGGRCWAFGLCHGGEVERREQYIQLRKA